MTKIDILYILLGIVFILLVILVKKSE